ncbi:hypothetical protein [Streptosporangium album]|uniref:hypothetical protein n=1 Tax=Streptosporangium album TaxID=47479 RepID=UPI003CD090EA
MSQFVTGTGNGGLTAHPGGDRWRWESRIFARAPTTRRPRDKVEQTVTAWVAARRHDVVYRGKAVKGSWWRALATRIEAHTDEGSVDDGLKPPARWGSR